MRRKLDPLILALCIAWIAILGGLGISAIAQEHLAIGTRLGVSTSEGLSATISGVILIGFALLGLLPTLDGNRIRRIVLAFAAVLWLFGSLVVLLWRQ